jgi:hypothetical protein
MRKKKKKKKSQHHFSRGSVGAGGNYPGNSLVSFFFLTIDREGSPCVRRLVDLIINYPSLFRPWSCPGS